MTTQDNTDYPIYMCQGNQWRLLNLCETKPIYDESLRGHPRQHLILEDSQKCKYPTVYKSSRAFVMYAVNVYKTMIMFIMTYTNAEISRIQLHARMCNYTLENTSPNKEGILFNNNRGSCCFKSTESGKEPSYKKLTIQNPTIETRWR